MEGQRRRASWVHRYSAIFESEQGFASFILLRVNESTFAVAKKVAITETLAATAIDFKDWIA